MSNEYLVPYTGKIDGVVKVTADSPQQAREKAEELLGEEGFVPEEQDTWLDVCEDIEDVECLEDVEEKHSPTA